MVWVGGSELGVGGSGEEEREDAEGIVRVTLCDNVSDASVSPGHPRRTGGDPFCAYTDFDIPLTPIVCFDVHSEVPSS